MDEMLKQVQHDGRVGCFGITESVINGRHPELVSGSLLILRGSVRVIVEQNEIICWEDCALILSLVLTPEGIKL
jgi:hypothetical protein